MSELSLAEHVMLAADLAAALRISAFLAHATNHPEYAPMFGVCDVIPCADAARALAAYEAQVGVQRGEG